MTDTVVSSATREVVIGFERPFVIAHEWSHLGGLADEGEANLAGWLACLHGTPAAWNSRSCSTPMPTAGRTRPPER